MEEGGRMKLEITQEHIDKANRLSKYDGYRANDSCVLSLALAEQYPKEKKGGHGVFTIFGRLAGPHSSVHNEVFRITNRFDTGKKVKPCTLSWRKRKEEQEVREGVEG